MGISPSVRGLLQETVTSNGATRHRRVLWHSAKICLNLIKSLCRSPGIDADRRWANQIFGLK